MNRTELRNELIRMDIREDAYEIDQPANESECYVLKPSSWEVFYAERGAKMGLRIFQSEQEACEYLLLRVATDPSAKKTA